MKKPEHIIDTQPTDTESWGSYNLETKQWSEKVFSGKAIREWIQGNISLLKIASNTLNRFLSKLFGDNYVSLINTYTKSPIPERLNTAENRIGLSTDSPLKTGTLFARVKYLLSEVDNMLSTLTFETQNISPDPNKYYTTVYKELIVKEGENTKYSIDLEVPIANDYKIFNYSLKIQLEVPSSWSTLRTTQTSNTITTTLKDLLNVSNWYNQPNLYIILKYINGKTSVADYINVTDSLGGSLNNLFENPIINNNIVYIKWNGLSPLDTSDLGIKITFKI